MSIRKIVGVAVGNGLFKATGIMSKKTVLRKSGEIAQETATRVVDGKAIDEVEFIDILKKYLGKLSDKIKLVPTKESFLEEMKKASDISEEMASKIYDTCESLIYPRIDGVLLNLRLQELAKSKEKLVNVTGHECEHALFESYSISSKFREFLRKIPFVSKKIEKAVNSGEFDLLQSRQSVAEGLLIQISKRQDIVGLTTRTNNLGGLIEQSRQKSAKNFERDLILNMYNSKVIEPRKYKQNLETCDVLISSFKDESRAYEVGGKAEQYLYKLLDVDTKGYTTNSELSSQSYKILVEILQKERKIARKNIIRSWFGLKPKTEHEDKVIKYLKEIEQYMIKKQKDAKLEQQAKNVEEFWQQAINYAV